MIAAVRCGRAFAHHPPSPDGDQTVDDGAPRWTLPGVRCPMTAQRGRPAGPLPDHGTRARYQHRTTPCHCDRCKAANTVAVRTWRYTGTTAQEVIA